MRVAAIGAAIAIPGPLLLFVLLQNSINIPYYDEWFWGRLLVSLHDGTLSLNDLWLPHNEHRIFFPTLIALTFAKLFGWNVTFESVFGLTLLTLSQFSLFRMARDTLGANWGAVAFVVASIVLFSLGQVENVMWGFQIAWFLVIFCLITTIDILRSGSISRPMSFAAACLCFISAFSSAFGLLVPIIAAFMVATRNKARLREVSIWVAYALALVFAYMYNLQLERPGLSQMHNASFVDRLVYLCTYLGSPVAGWSGSQVSGWIGAGGLAWALVSAIIMVSDVRNSGSRSRWMPWLALLFFALGAAMLTGFGRARLGIDQALSSRYTTLGAQFWISIVPITVLSFNAIGRRSYQLIRRGLTGVALAAFAVLLYGVGMQSASGYQYAVATSLVRLAALTELERDPSKVSDSTLLPIYPNPLYLRSVVQDLSKDGYWPLQ